MPESEFDLRAIASDKNATKMFAENPQGSDRPAPWVEEYAASGIDGKDGGGDCQRTDSDIFPTEEHR